MHNDSTSWSPTAYSVICSVHFVDGEPTTTNPLPTLQMGYNINLQIAATVLSKSRRPRPVAEECTLINSDRKTSHQASVASTTVTQQHKNTATVPTQEHSNSSIKLEPFDDEKSEMHTELTHTDAESDSQNVTFAVDETDNTRKKLKALQGVHMAKCMLLRAKQKQLKQLQRPLHLKLLTSDSNVLFYTGLPSLSTFKSLSKYIKEFQYKPLKPTTVTIKLKYKAAKLGKKRQVHLSTEEKILLTLMKLRLGLLHKDLADR